MRNKRTETRVTGSNEFELYELLNKCEVPTNVTMLFYSTVVLFLLTFSPFKSHIVLAGWKYTVK